MPFHYIACGAGLQSSTLTYLAVGQYADLPRPDAVIFADTEREPEWVYRTVNRLCSFCDYHGVPFHVVGVGDLGQDALDVVAGRRKRFSTIPFFVPKQRKNGTMGYSRLMRNCTRDYKIRPIERKVRALLGYPGRKRIPEGVLAHAWLGITTDEASRMKPSRTRWVKTVYPLIDLGMSSDDCVAFLEKHGFPVPKKSSCYFCPFHSSRYWRDLHDNHPAEWEKAVTFDGQIRGLEGKAGIKGRPYLHPDCKPLPEIDSLRGDTFEEECEGYCGL